MKVCACNNCPRFDTEEKKADCRKRKLKRQLSLPSFDREAWAVVKNDLRPLLTDLILSEQWEEVAEFWKFNRWMVERAILGK